MAEYPRLRPAIPFSPCRDHLLFHMPLFARNEVPRYLFRVHDPSSAGTTTTSHVIPVASSNTSHLQRGDIFYYQQIMVAEELHSHLAWKTMLQGGGNLTSWTSSLLFALQYGLHRHAKSTTTPLAEINVMVIDTQAFPDGTFVKDVELMRSLTSESPQNPNLLKLLSLRENPTRAGERFYFGEYLSQGYLDVEGRCGQTTMDKIISMGLFDLQPAFADKSGWPYLGKSILKIRERITGQFFSNKAIRGEVRKAIAIASGCFGDRWALPVATMLLALRHRFENDPVILNGMAAMFYDWDAAEYLGDPSQIDTWQLPEAAQYANLAKEIVSHLKEVDIKESMDRLLCTAKQFA